MGNDSKIGSGLYDHLIDAEREALSRAGRRVGKIELIKALREASGLDLREANQEVQVYLARRNGQIPGGPVLGRQASGWIDDLLDAERASASKEDRPINKIVLIKALRGVSPISLRDAKDAVEDYLRRRGGDDLPSGTNDWWVTIVLIGLGIVVAVAVIVALR